MNSVTPPSKWPALMQARALFTYGTTSCDQCWAIVPAGSWVVRDSAGRLICEDCASRNYGYRKRERK